MDKVQKLSDSEHNICMLIKYLHSYDYILMIYTHSAWGYNWATLSLGDINTERPGPSGWGLDARLRALLYKKNTVAKSKEVITGSNLTESYKEGFDSKRAVLPMMMIHTKSPMKI
jgi:hypothetical protein